MVELTVQIPGGKAGSKLIRRYQTRFPQNIKAGLSRAGEILARQIKHNLSGPSHTRFPGNGNPYPGVLTGRLRASVFSRLISNGRGVRIGPNTNYAADQEQHPRYGRPYVAPAWEQKGDKALDAIADQLKKY